MNQCLFLPLIPLPRPRDYPYRNSTGEVPSEILQAPIHGAGGRGWKGGCFASVHWKMENKDHNGQR